MKNLFATKSSNKDQLAIVVSVLFIFLMIMILIYRYVDPAPPNHLAISTSDGEGDYDKFAKIYQEIFKDNGVTLELRKSTGAAENYQRLKDAKSDIDVGFVQDGLGSPEDAPDLVSLGSLYYEPIWIFYRAELDKGHVPMTRFSNLTGKKIAVGHPGGGTRMLSVKILNSAGINEKNTNFINLGWKDAGSALRKDQIDAAIFLATPEDSVIQDLLSDSTLRLMSMDQAEAITRQIPFLHHLVLPHGAINLEKNIPNHDIDMVSPTATLLVRDSVHPALVYLLLHAASQTHDGPGLFERKNEFPVNKVDQFPLSDEASNFYKSGVPFWQKHLPFWLATLADRFIVWMIPLFALLFPVVKLIPQLYQWNIRKKIYRYYGELKYLETQILQHPSEKHEAQLNELDRIEERVKKMKVPIQFAEHIYSLRGHIDFVRARLLKH